MKFDYSTLSTEDIGQIALQRTSSLVRVPIFGRLSYAAWRRGYNFPLALEASVRRRSILGSVELSIRNEVEEMKSYLPNNIDHMADIGCGHGIMDLILAHEYGCTVHLIDIEDTAHRDHNFRIEGSGYSSLASARALLLRNGIREDQIRLTNPKKQRLIDSGLDLVISLLSCGFHYPIETYSGYIASALKDGGTYIFDLRHNTDQEKYLSRFSEVRVIRTDRKSRRLACTK
jgi:hypothetical protein